MWNKYVLVHDYREVCNAIIVLIVLCNFSDSVLLGSIPIWSGRFYVNQTLRLILARPFSSSNTGPYCSSLLFTLSANKVWKRAQSFERFVPKHRYLRPAFRKDKFFSCESGCNAKWVMFILFVQFLTFCV